MSMWLVEPNCGCAVRRNMWNIWSNQISFEGVSRSATCAVVGDKMTIFLRSAGGLFCRLNTDVSVRLKSVCGIRGNKCCGTCCIPDK
eukprot:scaffold11791_cov75-Cylindrotheca_fusiformis.AAC.1